MNVTRKMRMQPFPRALFLQPAAAEEPKHNKHKHNDQNDPENAHTTSSSSTLFSPNVSASLFDTSRDLVLRLEWEAGQRRRRVSRGGPLL
jgi:hypothetical protein